MSINLAEQYYIKAFDNYPYDLEEAIESINYSLSYDADSAKAHVLMGRIQAEQLNNWAEAEYHFEQAIANDYSYIRTYGYYADLLIETRRLTRAEKLLNFALKVKGMDLYEIHYRAGLIYELRKQFKVALAFYKRAKNDSIKSWQIEFLDEQITRVEGKLNPKKRENKEDKKEN